MKNKNLVRRQAEKVILTFLFLLCFLARFFVFGKNASAEDITLVISEVSAGIGSATNEFVEIYNYGDAEINLQDINLKLKLINSSGSATLKTISWTNTIIPSKGFFLFGAGTVSVAFDATYGGTLLTGTGGVIIADENDVMLDKLTWTGLKTNQSMERIGGNLSPNNNSSFFLQENPNPQNSAFVEPPPVPEPPPPSEPKIYSKNIRINELFPDPTESPEKDFEYIELYNFDAAPIDLSGWVLKNKNGQAVLSGNIGSQAYLSLQGKLTLHNDGDTITLIDPNGEEVFSINYAEEDILPGYSYNFSDSTWKWSSFLTPGEENKFDPPPAPEPDPEPAPEPKDYSDEIYLSEIFPYPPSGGEEFIELYNPAEKDIDLSDWILRDASKTGKYIFPKNISIKSLDYLVVYKKDFKFALNNSGAESVTLYDPDEKIVSKVSYSGAKENLSYNFNGKDWHWSKFLTPGAKNIFNNPPAAKTAVPKTAYVNMYADFSAKGSDKDHDKLKYTWDFGDGHKSYLQNTRHKFTKAGKYTVTLKIFDGSEDKIQTFKIAIEKFPKLSVKIIELSPNPKGKDADTEFITIRNNSKKKINLNGWSIATGSKKLYNHPIMQDLFIRPGKEIKLTRAYSKFTLNNKASTVELRYPTGKVASKLSYASKKNIMEDAIYARTNSDWQWQTPKAIIAKATPVNIVPQVEITSAKAEPQAKEDTNIGKYSESDYWKNKQDNKIILLSYNSEIKTPSIILAQSGRIRSAFTQNQPTKKHWAVVLLENINTRINILFTQLILAT